MIRAVLVLHSFEGLHRVVVLYEYALSNLKVEVVGNRYVVIQERFACAAQHLVELVSLISVQLHAGEVKGITIEDIDLLLEGSSYVG